MAPDPAFVARVDALIALFNRKGMDLPDGLFDRRTQFAVNGAPFETLLGGSPTDSLVLTLARGHAGYRFTVKGLQHAVPDATVERGDLSQTVEGDVVRVHTQLWLSGRIRETHDPIETVVSVVLTLVADGLVTLVAATMPEPDLEKIRVARRNA